MNVYDFTVLNNKKEEVSLREYEGKVLLIVNTATKCGLTPQYEQLEALYEKYHDQGFEILDFPCNQFLGQAPGEDEEINQFCTLNYGTKFPRFSKIDVNGKNQAPLYKYLKEIKPYDYEDEAAKKFAKKVKLLKPFSQETDIKWNFGKFLIDQKGNVVERFSPAIIGDVIDQRIKQLIG